MIRILHTESSKEIGGQELRIIKKLHYLKKRGYWVGLVASKDSGIFKLAKEKEILVFDLDLSRRRLITLYKLVSITKRKNIDIVHTHSSRDSWYGLAVKIINSRVKLVRTRHISTPVKKHFFNKILYQKPDLIFTTGEKIKEYIESNFARSPGTTISLPSGIDINLFNRDHVRPALNKEGLFYVGTISILRSWKGINYLLEVIADISRNLADIRCIIVGDGPQKENLQELARKLNIERYVTFLGYRKDIPEILASLDILVHPSTAHEGLPQVILQALAMEVPVIATDVGSVAEVVINNRTGILIPPKDHNAIKKAILNIYQNYKHYKKMAQNGRKLVEKDYTFDSIVKKLEHYYISLFNS